MSDRQAHTVTTIPGTVTATLTLATDFASIPEDSVARTTFETNFKADVAAAIGVTAGQIFITSISDGSVVVEFAVTPAEDGTPADASAVSTAFASSGVSIAGSTTTLAVASVATTAGELAPPPPPPPAEQTPPPPPPADTSSGPAPPPASGAMSVSTPLAALVAAALMTAW